MKKGVFFLICLLSVLALNIYLRSFPINFPQLKTRARSIVEQGIRDQVAREVYGRFPQFNPLANDRLINNRFSEYKKRARQQINKQVNDLYRQLKDRYQDDTGQTYLFELDCWHWARYVENVVRLGHPGDEVVNGQQWDLLMLAPSGTYLRWEYFLYYFSAGLYKLFSLFKHVPLFTFVFYLPLLFSAIFIVLLYIFSFRYGRHIGAITACLFMGVAPIFLQRSCAGWFKKDPLNFIFSLLVIWTYIKAYEDASFKKRLFWVCFSGFWVGLFCFNWTHWWFVFLIILIYEVLSLAYLVFARFYLKQENSRILKERCLFVSLFVISSLVFLLVFSGPGPLIVLYNHVMLALILNKPLMSSIWPNVFSTVGELRRLSLREMADSMGGILPALAGAVSIVTLFINAVVKKKYSGFRRETIIILAIWFVAMLFASTRGIRFVIFLLLPLSVSLGWLMNEIYAYFRTKKHVTAAVLVLIAAVIINGISVNKGFGAAKSLFPLMDDTWYRILNIIKEKTPPETIVNSWWDFGDWFKVVAKRRVIFDGQSQDSPQAYWMGKALLTGNEEEAIGILRMLNNGGNRAFEIINEQLQDPLQSVLLLESLILMKPERAQETLLEFLSGPAANEVMKILFSNPSRACFIVDNTMVFKMPAISYLGSWDFSKVYIAQNFSKKEKEQILERLKKLGKDTQEMQRFYQEAFLISEKNLDDWLSNRLQFYSPLANGREKDGMISFDNGFVYNPKEQTIRSGSGQIPRSLFVLIGNNFTELIYPNANIGVSIMIITRPDGYKCIMLDRQLANSMFSRLYFFNGAGLRHFLPFIDAENGNNYIRVFNIAW